MEIKGINGLSDKEILAEVKAGGKFVIYQYCISIIVMTFMRPTDICFIRSNESAFLKGLPYTFISMFFGWWGFPWGPIYTIGSFITNFKGGKDVTDDVIPSFRTVKKSRTRKVEEFEEEE